jgi:hypothetical protein
MTTELEAAFATYFEELERCKATQCYWSLLHLLVVLPAICAALETDKGEAGGDEYKNWCKRSFGRDKSFTPSDRYALRCALLHQGRTVTDEGQYGSYSIVAAGGDFHRWVEIGDEHKPNFTIDVGTMVAETVKAIRSWFASLQTAEISRQRNIRRHLRWLARSGKKLMPSSTGITTVYTTSSTGGYGGA